MMRTPTEFELQHLLANYDPVQAHEYYEKHKKLKGRKKGSGLPPGTTSGRDLSKGHIPKTSRTARQINRGGRAQQRKELQARIQSLSKKLAQLEAKIKQKEHAAAGEDRKAKAKKERAAKEKDKPTTAAEKAKAARENKKYRDKHKQEVSTKARQASKSGGGSSKSKESTKSTSKASVSDLRTLATKVKGQIAVAKQKLAAL